MASLTTGLIENTPVAGVRPTSSFTVKITNDDTISAAVQIDGKLFGSFAFNKESREIV